MLMAVFLNFPVPCQDVLVCWPGALPGIGCQKLSDGRVFHEASDPASVIFLPVSGRRSC
jgi:hypothetical protein